MLGRDWRIDVSREPSSGLQSMLPWLALAWPFAVAAIVFAIGRAITLRRRAQREVERIFELSLDLICVIDLDGRFKAVNPAFERTLGYSQEQLLSRPFLDFVDPEDQQATRKVFADLLSRDEVNQFENRYICADGSERWLQWSARAVPERGVVHGTARDVTERRRVDAELRDAKRTAEARGAELQVRAGEQAALRRVATIVARQASQAEVVTAIADEIGRLLGTEVFRIVRYEDDGTAVVVASSGAGTGVFAVGSRHRLGGTKAVRASMRPGARRASTTTAARAAR
jgi:PAS domain S-box-containing protein